MRQADEQTMGILMNHTAFYYPSISISTDPWLRRKLLYRDKIASIVPSPLQGDPSFVTRDKNEARNDTICAPFVISLGISLNKEDETAIAPLGGCMKLQERTISTDSKSTPRNSSGFITANWSTTRFRISTANSVRGAISFRLKDSGVRWG